MVTRAIEMIRISRVSGMSRMSTMRKVDCPIVNLSSTRASQPPLRPGLL